MRSHCAAAPGPGPNPSVGHAGSGAQTDGDMSPRRKFIVGAWLLGLAGCDQHSCNYDEPMPDPIDLSERDVPYPTQDGHFEVTLRADEWPPMHEAFALRIEVGDPDPPDDALPLVVRGAGPPIEVEERLVAEVEPDVTPVDPRMWEVTADIPEPGVWEMVVDIGVERDGDFEVIDTFTMHVRAI